MDELRAYNATLQLDAHGFPKPIEEAPEPARDLLPRIWQLLGYPQQRRGVLIGIDGLDGAGKSTLAAWLSWQCGIPVVSLDLYLPRRARPLQWRSADLGGVLESRLTVRQPIIVEGILLLDALSSVDQAPDFTVFVEDVRNSGNLPDLTGPYFEAHRPREKTDYVLRLGAGGSTWR
jgi:hypothetical protein